ncbi:MAG: hypothetical protein Q3966_00585 [Neisseria sp.]|nr:hypothetical protein [Neisseria sp.]
MNSLTLTAAIVGFAAGALLTWLNARGKSADTGAKTDQPAETGSRHQAEIKQQNDAYQALLQQFEAYRLQVDRHFADTAEAVDELNRTYQGVISRLNEGAQALMDAQALQQQLQQREGTAVTVGYLTSDKAAEEEAAPADTADTVETPAQSEDSNRHEDEAAETDAESQQAAGQEDEARPAGEAGEEAAEGEAETETGRPDDEAGAQTAEDGATRDGEQAANPAAEGANGQDADTEQNRSRVYY